MTLLAKTPTQRGGIEVREIKFRVSSTFTPIRKRFLKSIFSKKCTCFLSGKTPPLASSSSPFPLWRRKTRGGGWGRKIAHFSYFFPSSLRFPNERNNNVSRIFSRTFPFPPLPKSGSNICILSPHFHYSIFRQGGYPTSNDLRKMS